MKELSKNLSMFRRTRLSEENERILDYILDELELVDMSFGKYRELTYDDILMGTLRLCSPLIYMIIFNCINGEENMYPRQLHSKKINKGLKDVLEIIYFMNEMHERQVYSATKYQDLDLEDYRIKCDKKRG